MKLKHFLQRKIKNKKGMAIELAILLLVVTFSLSIIITSTSMLLYRKKNNAKEQMLLNTQIEQIGAKFCSSIAMANGNEWISEFPDYNIEISGFTLTVKEKDKEKVLLFVELSKENNKYRIIEWKTF